MSSMKLHMASVTGTDRIAAHIDSTSEPCTCRCRVRKVCCSGRSRTGSFFLMHPERTVPVVTVPKPENCLTRSIQSRKGRVSGPDAGCNACSERASRIARSRSFGNVSGASCSEKRRTGHPSRDVFSAIVAAYSSAVDTVSSSTRSVLLITMIPAGACASYGYHATGCFQQKF